MVTATLAPRNGRGARLRVLCRLRLQQSNHNCRYKKQLLANSPEVGAGAKTQVGEGVAGEEEREKYGDTETRIVSHLAANIAGGAKPIDPRPAFRSQPLSRDGNILLVVAQPDYATKGSDWVCDRKNPLFYVERGLDFVIICMRLVGV